jgi:carbon-monoxide dehydrogenase small subunit
MQIRLTVNGKPVRADVTPRTSLADFLREALNLTATHLGCEHGICGDGYEVRTLEGLLTDEIMLALRDAFHRHHGLQCGFCTPGMLVSARDLIQRGKAGSDSEIRKGLSGNICRCTGYTDIVRSVRKAAEALSEAGKVRSPSGDVSKVPA